MTDQLNTVIFLCLFAFIQFRTELSDLKIIVTMGPELLKKTVFLMFKIIQPSGDSRVW